MRKERSTVDRVRIQLWISFGVLAIFLSACGVAGIFGGGNKGNIIDQQYIAPRVGELAPNFELQTLEGTTTQLADYRGKVVLLNFWATWCAPCRLEMPLLNERYDAHRSEFVILAINDAEPKEVVRQYADELNLTFPVLLDSDSTIQDLFQVRGYPSSVFLDADGIIRIIHVGIMTEDQLDGYLAEVGVGVQ